MPVKEHRAADYLKTPEDVAAYLNAVIEEMGDDPRLLMKAFRNVAEAQGGVSRLAAKANLDRVALSRTLSGRRNPRLDTLAKMSAALRRQAQVRCVAPTAPLPHVMLSEAETSLGGLFPSPSGRGLE